MRLSLLVREILEQKTSNITVLLTREQDQYVALDERTAFANKQGGDLFVSIHVNASTDQRVSGIETYSLSFTADQAALDLAARENASSSRSLSEFQEVLKDIVTHGNTQESVKLAKIIQEALFGKPLIKQSTRNLGTKQAPFLVLVGSQMPSILVEVAFISNPKENQLIQDDKYLQNLANGIAAGLLEYVRQVEADHRLSEVSF